MSMIDDVSKSLIEELLAFESLPGEEGPAQRWLEDQLSELGFETYSWEPDRELLADHPSFPPLETLDLDDRPSVAGVLEFGDPDAGRTIVLNGHVDVVPVAEEAWSSDPFTPRWDGDRLYGRGALDMKSGLVACIAAAHSVAEQGTDLDGRIVVESVVGEEEGGIGAATSAGANPYPFERDAVLVAEPTDFELVTATEGSVMKRLTVYGKPAHAAARWEGESVLPHFDRIRRAFMDLEAERTELVTHPLYENYEIPWPVNFGTVRAGSWASSVPAELTSEIRIGVSPTETVREVEREFEDRLAEVVAESDWLSQNPPDFERFSVQFEGSEVDHDEPIVQTVADTVADHGMEPTYKGLTGGTDGRHYVDAGIPALVFGPGGTSTAHKANEYTEWSDVALGTEIFEDVITSFLSAS